MSYDPLFSIISDLVMCHSPSGVEDEINLRLIDHLAHLGVDQWRDQADNVIAKISGKDDSRAVAITAHKDEIGTLVKSIYADGRVSVRKLGSDASIAMKFGHVSRAACLSFPTHNTHGYEIAHLGAIAHCAAILEHYCNDL